MIGVLCVEAIQCRFKYLVFVGGRVQSSERRRFKRAVYLSTVIVKHEELSANIREVESEWKKMYQKCLNSCS